MNLLYKIYVFLQSVIFFSFQLEECCKFLPAERALTHRQGEHCFAASEGNKIILEALKVEDYITFGIVTADDGYAAALKVVKADVAGCFDIIFFHWKVNHVVHPQKIFVNIHFGVPIRDFFIINLPQRFYFGNGSDETQADLRWNQWINGDFEKDFLAEFYDSVSGFCGDFWGSNYKAQLIDCVHVVVELHQLTQE